MKQWVIEPFNTVYFCFFGTVAALLVFCTLFLLRKPLSVRRRVMVIFTSVLAGLLVLYKLLLPLDGEFMRDYADYWGPYTLLNELPFNPCNLVLLLFPIALYRKNDWLLSFCCFMGLISTTLAAAMPQQGYAGYSILCLHTFGFFLLHFTGALLPLVIVILGLYEPEYGDILRSSAVIAVSAAWAFLLNLLLRLTGANPLANYFFAMDPEGNPVFELFHRLIPVPGLYLVGTLAIYCPAAALLVFLYRIIRRK